MKICISCNLELEDNKFRENRNQCKNCRTIYNRNKANQRIKNGFCYVCNRQQMNNSIYCERHWYEKVSSIYLSRKRWNELKDLAIKQNFKCVYTGTNLVPVINMSLDHIKPISKFPDLKNEISNLQWVTKDINTAKNNLSHDDFIKLCKEVSKNYE